LHILSVFSMISDKKSFFHENPAFKTVSHVIAMERSD